MPEVDDERPARRWRLTSGSYDFTTPPDLETRLENLINWWRHQSDETGDDCGSIVVMADQLERVMRKESGDGRDRRTSDNGVRRPGT